MRRTAAVLLLLLATSCYPPSARAVDWEAAAPTTGGPVFGYQTEININGTGWAAYADSIPTPVWSHDQYVGTAVQFRVRAFNRVVSAQMDGTLLVGVTVGPRRYGIWSENGEVSVLDIEAPGGCGMPVRR